MAGIIQKSARRFITQIGAAGVPDAITTTVPLVSTSGLPIDTEVEIIVDRTDSGGNFTPLKEEVVRGTVSGNNLINCTRGVEGSAQAHSAGAVVNQILTSSMWNQFSQYVKDVGLVMYPVGSIYTSVVNTNPNTFFGGTWTSFATGRTLVGVDTGQTEFDTVEETGGAKTHTHTINGHTHNVTTSNHSHNVTTSNHTHNVSGSTGSSQGGFGAFGSGSLGPDGNHTHNFNVTSESSGGQTVGSTSNGAETITSTNSGTLTSNAGDTLQPYITVYFFKRTA
jgi:hypothetical protein